MTLRVKNLKTQLIAVYAYILQYILQHMHKI